MLLNAFFKGILASILDFSMLGYREKDLVEQALNLYARSAEVDMNSWFDHRKRGMYEDRYDSRKALQGLFVCLPHKQ